MPEKDTERADKLTSIIKKRINCIKYVLLGCVAMMCLQSCFTGVEGTSKINLSKREMNAVAPSQEDLYLSDVKIDPLKNWTRGKEFLIADQKFQLVTVISGKGVINVGDTIMFDYAESSTGAGGGEITVLHFLKDDTRISYTSDKSLKEAQEGFTSLDLPMLIDLAMVEEAKKKLMGKTLWTKTALWYDNNEYKKGRKFQKVEVTEVLPGNSFFPVLVKFTDSRGESGELYINIGYSGNESRSFGKLFSLTDPKNNYKQITPENWEAIQGETVRIGMTKEECRLAKGAPSDVDMGHNYSNAMEVWFYGDGSYLQFVDGLLVNFK